MSSWWHARPATLKRSTIPFRRTAARQRSCPLTSPSLRRSTRWARRSPNASAGSDVLVGNAAILGTLSPIGHTDPETWERTFAVNVTANWRLIRAFDPILRASDSGRAIFVTSGVGSRAIPYYGAYAASKAALNRMVETYAAEVTKTKLKVNLIDPGVVRTAMRAQAFPGEDPAGLPPPESVTEAFVRLAGSRVRSHGKIVHA